jgi:hypothetical protein
MTDPADSLDTMLLERFSREHAQPPAEPFLSETARCVASARTRSVLAKRIAQGVALAALILVSPWLIKVSALMSMHLDDLLGVMMERLFTPIGTAAVFVLGAVGVVLVHASKMRHSD